ncbi:hypothetical protein LGQ02_18275 [Bacillus shivajii]|uniref:hypothetical protein n=1 Tax=Bacillus shivajii TaxID=1983719 RepID=UPI001CFA8391|nr:hypothetical protein [Bacillus shivajii]UCZ52707.1 hypothetical protein LGQ02_18275 [Bacillus shivajii]
MSEKNGTIITQVDEDAEGIKVGDCDHTGVGRQCMRFRSRLVNKDIEMNITCNRSKILRELPLPCWYHQEVVHNQYNQQSSEMMSHSIFNSLNGIVSNFAKNANDRSWDKNTERLMQQVSMRYADEVLNALTPVSGMLQLMKEDELSVHDFENLIKESQKEVAKSKSYIQDFLILNHPSSTEKDWICVCELYGFVKQSVQEHTPEFITHIQWEVTYEDREPIFVDKNKVRMITQLIVKKWMDFIDHTSPLKISFLKREVGKLEIRISSEANQSTQSIVDDEFDFYCHLVERHLKENDGKLKVHWPTLTLVL